MQNLIEPEGPERMPLSDFVRSMNEDDKIAYLSKLEQMGFSNEEDDPFLVEQSLSKKLLVKWSHSIEAWPDVEFGNLYVFLINCPGKTQESLKSYRSSDAYQFFKKGCVHNIYIRHSQTGCCIVRANIKRFEDSPDQLYKAWVGFNNDDGSIITGHCTCMTSLAPICSHVVAIVFQVEAATRLGFKNKACCTCPCQCNKQISLQLQGDVISSDISRRRISERRIKEDTVFTVSTDTETDDPNQMPGSVTSSAIISRVKRNKSVIKTRATLKPKRQISPRVSSGRQRNINFLKTVKCDDLKKPNSQSRRSTRKNTADCYSKAPTKEKKTKSHFEDLEDCNDSQGTVDNPRTQMLDSHPPMEEEGSVDTKPHEIIMQRHENGMQMKLRLSTLESKSEQQPQGDYICHLCKSPFSSSAFLEHHMQQEHSLEYEKIVEEYQNVLKLKREKSHFKIIDKIRVKKMKKTFLCKECGKSFNYSSDLQKHMRQHTGEKPFKCDECDKSYRNSSDFYRHKRTHTGIKPFKCNECEKSFGDKSSLQRHKRTHTGEKPYKCVECLKTFTDSSHLHAHKRTHTGEKPFKCEECGKCYGTGSSLQTHMRKHTGERPYKCNVCNRSFGNISYLRVHRRRHTGEKPYLCNECGKSFFNSSDLSRHMKLHTGEYPFICIECGKGFSSSTHLNSHMGRHTGIKPFKCKECDKSFCYGCDLKAHMRRHTGERPFKCFECGKGFAQSSDRYRHMRTHTGEKHFKCKECGKSYTDNGSLHRHMKKTHRHDGHGGTSDIGLISSTPDTRQALHLNSYIATGEISLAPTSRLPHEIVPLYSDSIANPSFSSEQMQGINLYNSSSVTLDNPQHASEHIHVINPYIDSINSTHPAEHSMRMMSFNESTMNNCILPSNQPPMVNAYNEGIMNTVFTSENGQ